MDRLDCCLVLRQFKIVDAESVSVRKDYGLFNAVLQLTDIATSGYLLPLP